MKCMKHEERAAVATCSKCGKFLCKECAKKYSPYTLCDECYHALVEKEMKSRKHCFIGSAIMGVPLIMLCFLMMLLFNDYGISDFLLSFVFIAIVAGFPYGWRAFNRLFARAHYRNFIITFLIKYFCSWIIGGPCLVYHVVKYGIMKEEADLIV